MEGQMLQVTGETSVTMHLCHEGTSQQSMLSVGHYLFPAMSIMISHALLAASTLTTAEMLCLAALRQVAQEPLDVHF